MVALSRDDMIDGLRDLVIRLHAVGSTASIRIVGGAAMPLYDDDTVSIWVASPGALLAMKLRAARAARDTGDIATLLAITAIDSVEAAEQLYEHYFPGELPPSRAYPLLESIFETDLPEAPRAPQRPLFE